MRVTRVTVPAKKSILIEIVAFTESRPVAFPDYADHLYTRKAA